jgi:hypothetical protein
MLDRRLKRSLSQDVEAVTVQERGWGSKENGELLGLAQEEFDALLTADRGIPHQQDLSRFDLTVVVLEAKSNDIEDLAPLMDQAVEALRSARPGEAIRVTA